eukprot:TRINITY_DN42549_c0_g1_i1.p1 TRINITY_DN42549_c0_g1~~TRINITY_DN42549_c0_g1_i1.p1  ORF type:complete len:711 (-),score=48.67 TRINITY_DN42549_c0_g1_i1:113-2194(-)
MDNFRTFATLEFNALVERLSRKHEDCLRKLEAGSGQNSPIDLTSVALPSYFEHEPVESKSASRQIIENNQRLSSELEEDLDARQSPTSSTMPVLKEHGDELIPLLHRLEQRLDRMVLSGTYEDAPVKSPAGELSSLQSVEVEPASGISRFTAPARLTRSVSNRCNRSLQWTNTMPALTRTVSNCSNSSLERRNTMPALSRAVSTCSSAASYTAPVEDVTPCVSSVELPLTLFVASLEKEGSHYDGTYNLVHDERLHGMPRWKSIRDEKETYWLQATKEGTWCITQNCDEREANTEFVSSLSLHDGKLYPNVIGKTWRCHQDCDGTRRGDAKTISLSVQAEPFVRSKALSGIGVPGEFSKRVFRRALEIVDMCAKSTLVVIAYGEEIPLGKPLEPHVDEYWSLKKLRVFDVLPQTALDNWSCGSVVIHPLSGQITSVTNPIDLQVVKSRIALAAVNMCRCMAIYKQCQPGISPVTSVFSSFCPQEVRVCKGPTNEKLSEVEYEKLEKQTQIKRQEPSAREFEQLNGKMLPFIDDLPKVVSENVFRAAVTLAVRYAREGVEGVIKGHTLVLGSPDDLKRLGTVKGLNDFRNSDEHKISVTDAKAVEVVRRRMNLDGMTLIDGLTGRVFCNCFFTQKISDEGSGARSASSRAVAEYTWAGAIILKISEDTSGGRITILLGKEKGSTAKVLEQIHTP